MDAEAEAAHLALMARMRLVAGVVAAYVRRTPVAAEALPELVRVVDSALTGLSAPPARRSAETRLRPAVPINRSVHHDYLICLEDGKQLKMLKRYLRARHGMTPEEYRRRWGLPPDYPMVAPAYAARRSAFAKEIGLGRGVRRRP